MFCLRVAGFNAAHRLEIDSPGTRQTYQFGAIITDKPTKALSAGRSGGGTRPSEAEYLNGGPNVELISASPRAGKFAVFTPGRADTDEPFHY